jgi:pectin methylesterase-like acyl-CoA thioesterase
MKTMLSIAIIVCFIFMFQISSGYKWRVPDDFPTIQHAVQGSIDGDTITILPGVYKQNVDLSGKSLTLSFLGFENREQKRGQKREAGERKFPAEEINFHSPGKVQYTERPLLPKQVK